MILLFLVVFMVGMCIGLWMGQWSIYRYYKRKTGREFYPDVFKISRGEQLKYK